MFSSLKGILVNEKEKDVDKLSLTLILNLYHKLILTFQNFK